MRRIATSFVLGASIVAVLISCSAKLSAQDSTRAFRVIAFFTGKKDAAHLSFLRKAERWLPEIAAQNPFGYDTTSNWDNLNATFLARHQVVVFLDTRPDYVVRACATWRRETPHTQIRLRSPCNESAQSTDASTVHPPELQDLLHCTDPAAGEAAWTRLVQSYTPLLLHAVRSVAPESDAAMDAYAYVLERLREDEFKRLRAFAIEGRSSFGTWLVVVARRLCIDRHRQLYGRPPRGEHDVAAAHAERLARRRLLDLTALPIDAADIVDDAGDSPDQSIRVAELRCALDAALGDLSVADRVLLKLRFEDGLSAQAAASALGLPTPFHVYRQLNAIYATLRQKLATRGVVSSAP